MTRDELIRGGLSEHTADQLIELAKNDAALHCAFRVFAHGHGEVSLAQLLAETLANYSAIYRAAKRVMQTDAALRPTQIWLCPQCPHMKEIGELSPKQGPSPLSEALPDHAGARYPYQPPWPPTDEDRKRQWARDTITSYAGAIVNWDDPEQTNAAAWNAIRATHADRGGTAADFEQVNEARKILGLNPNHPTRTTAPERTEATETRSDGEAPQAQREPEPPSSEPGS